MVLNHHMHIIYTALRIIWYIKYFMGKPIIYLTIPTKFYGRVINNIKSTVLWYTRVSVETVKLNIHLE